MSQNVLKSYLKKWWAKIYLNVIWKSPKFVPFRANLAHFGVKSAIVSEYGVGKVIRHHVEDNRVCQTIKYPWHLRRLSCFLVGSSHQMLVLHSITWYVNIIIFHEDIRVRGLWNVCRYVMCTSRRHTKITPLTFW